MGVRWSYCHSDYIALASIELVQVEEAVGVGTVFHDAYLYNY